MCSAGENQSVNLGFVHFSVCILYFNNYRFCKEQGKDHNSVKKPELEELEMKGKSLERRLPWKPWKGGIVLQLQMARGEQVA